MVVSAKKARPQGALAYSFATPQARKGRTLYVNTVGNYSCTNSCRFCSRKDAINGKPNIYEKKAGTSLYLPRPPQSHEMAAAIMKEMDAGDAEPPDTICFVGLGEPLLNSNSIALTIIGLRTLEYKGTISMDTNGQAKLGVGAPESLPENLRANGLDEVRISVNATNEEDYLSLCRPLLGRGAFKSVIGFLDGCLKAGMGVFASFVVGFGDGQVRTREEGEYREFAESLGVKRENVLAREYAPPIAGN